MRADELKARVSGCALGLDGSGEIYVGLGADDSRMPEALLVL